MNILFIHQNFPGQFRSIAPALASDSSNTVVAMTVQQTDVKEWCGIRLVTYKPACGTSPTVHPWVQDFEMNTILGDAAFRAALELRSQGFSPDIIIAHPGWGESLFLKDVWPDARMGIYSEFFYHANGADVGFDPEFPAGDPGEICRIRLKNINNFMHFEITDSAISPTFWQASTFPEPFRSRITVVHDGIDTNLLLPCNDAWLTLYGSITLNRNDEVITFVNRNLEPYRGYHIFMRALPELLRRRPKARVLIVGGEGISYGAAPPAGTTWKEIFAAEVRGRICDSDWSRVHFLGNIDYVLFVILLQISTVHVYLTYPFVLSWSLLEAMSCGCAIVASDTRPLHEAIIHDNTGRLVNFFDVDGLVEEVCSLLEDPQTRARLGENARNFAKTNYDLHSICLPRQLEWVKALADKPGGHSNQRVH